MKTKLKSVADELRDDLALCPDLRAQQLIDLDESLSDSIMKFEEKMTVDQGDEWNALKEKIDNLREYAQVAKMRLLFGDDELTAKLDAMHQSIGTESNESNEIKAAIDVQRDAHRNKGITDILKALLMWKDSPEDLMK
ncbi:hypothetical protein [Rubritalea profundi]|uniref:Uncharacterized protein n=1 Tax=Rubritalea profundi TaxID=1658618 RepID=A0A2S7U4Y7_9BACT|nr:hypothetical protein [Rubritalea profundi]PQJ29577.1 hypothetical protein BSZ32_14480 [Rubritalea profundi]